MTVKGLVLPCYARLDEVIHVDWARSTAESIPAPAGFDGKWLSIKLFSLATALPIPVDDLIPARLATVSIGINNAVVVVACS